MDDAALLHFDRYGKIFVASVRSTRRLDQSNHEAFGAALMAHLEEHPGAHLLVSFSGVEFISSAVLSELIQALRAASKAGGGVRVCALSEYVASVFEVTNLDRTFHAGGHVRDAAERYNAELETANA